MPVPDEQVIVPIGSRVPVILERGPDDAARRALLPVNLPGIDLPLDPVEPPELSFYYLHTAYALRPDGINGYNQISLEASLSWTPHDKAAVREFMLSNFQDAVTLYGSGRTVPSALRVAAGTAYTDGLLAGILFTQDGVTKRVELIGLTTTWSRRQLMSTKLADIDALIADPLQSHARPELTAAREGIAAEAFEAWDQSSLSYVFREGTLRPRLMNGIHALGLVSDRQLQSWDSADEVNFRVTAVPVAPGARELPVVVRIGESIQSQVEIFNAPQVVEFLGQYYAIFLLGTVFFFSQIAVPQTFGFFDALPVLPYAYTLGTEHGGLVNSYAVSVFTSMKLHYRLALAQDEAQQVFGPFFFKILVNRIGGRMILIQVNQPAGFLCAIVNIREQRGNALRRYVWRETELVRPNVVIDFLPLQTEEVTGFNILDVDGGIFS